MSELSCIMNQLSVEEKKDMQDILDGRMDITSNRDLWEKLYMFYVTKMPYGTAKARTGDPANWIYDRLVSQVER